MSNTINKPEWTVFTNIDNGEYVGMQWEFFNDGEKAIEAYNHHCALPNRTPMIRRFHENDRKYMGACHR